MIVLILAEITSPDLFHPLRVMGFFPSMEQFFRLSPAETCIFHRFCKGDFLGGNQAEQYLQIASPVVGKALIFRIIAVKPVKSLFLQNGSGSSSSSSPEDSRLHIGIPCLRQKVQI